MLFVLIILIIVFFLNFICYWAFYFKNKKFKNTSSEIFSSIMIISAGLIPIVNSSLFQPFVNINISYFEEYWLWFILLGILFIGIGIKIHSLAIKALNQKINNRDQPQLLRKGIFEITRHPVYLSWVFIFLGITFVMDSIAAMIFCPILIVFIETLGFFEEKYILLPEFGKKYNDYKRKTPNRLISKPYNYLLIIIAILVYYLGFLNISGIA